MTRHPTAQGEGSGTAGCGGVPLTLRVHVAGRLALGIPAWLAPTFAGRVYGLDHPESPGTRYMLAVFGARAAALAVGTATAPDPATRRRWQLLCLGVDVADTIAGARIPQRRRARVVSVAMTGTYALTGLRELLRG